jgi:N-acetylmuramoyl-L-alanine amidase
MKICISAGHAKDVRGAAGPSPWGLDEVNEARRVVTQVAKELEALGIDAPTYWDDISTSQNENLNRIVDWHNSQTRELDVSIHFNAYEVTTTKPMGCEVLYVSSTGQGIATDVVNEICTASGLKNRGPKKRTDLFFLNETEEPAVLVEVCFCDAKIDCDIYRAQFTAISAAIAAALSGEEVEPPEPVPPGPDEALFHAKGRMSTFGGPTDTGVSPSEGLAFITSIEQAPHLFLPYQPTGTTGLARRLNTWVPYLACRWDYSTTSKELLRSGAMALVRANNMVMKAFPADWGPHQDTGRIADLSPGLADALGLDTDDECEVIFPYEDD